MQNESKDKFDLLKWEVVVHGLSLHHWPIWIFFWKIWVRAYLLGPERWWTMGE